MRLFVGIGLPGPVRQAVAEALGPLREAVSAVSWTPEPNLHVTLKFLGETDPARTGDIEGLLAAAADAVPPFELLVAGGGAFPGGASPRILWVGVREPLVLVEKLHENIDKALSSAGFPREARRFHPHVTVGRVRGPLPRAFGGRFDAAVAGKAFGAAPVPSFQLYESRLFPTGAVYRALRDFRLRGRDDT